MKRFAKIFFPIFVGLLILFPFVLAQGEALDENARENEEPTVIYFFDDPLCPVCKESREFLEEIKNDYPDLEMEVYSIGDTEKLDEVADLHGVEDPAIMAPTIFIGDNYFQFTHFGESHKEQLLKAIEGEVVDTDCCIVLIPFVNLEVDISEWSLPLITVILGSLDGFNVCSIGALILILSIVLVLESRRKIFFYGGLFIVTAVTVYGVLVFVWGQLFRALVGHLQILSAIIGLAALAGAVYFFKEFYRFYKHGPTCGFSDNKIVNKAAKKIQQTFSDSKKGALTLAFSVIVFAAIITLVELPCSIGIPIVFTGILIEAGVPLFTFVFYILLYLLFYMLIELVIFIGAVLTKEIWIANSKAITWVTLLGALVLFYLAFHYLFALFN